MFRSLAVMLVVLAAAAHADAQELREFEKTVRTADPYVRALIRDAMATSPWFNRIVARIQRSDVIVYVTRDFQLPPLVDGQTTLMAKSGATRYVKVHLAWDLTPRRHAATIAHELQHVVEIADAPGVVDEASLAREFDLSGAAADD